MVKTILYFVLFVLAHATVLLAAVSPVKRDTDSPRALTKRQEANYEENKKWKKACNDDCSSMPVKGMEGKTAKYTCRQQCDRNFPTEPTYGCYKNQCWSNCVATGLAREWCYTSTESYSQSYKYVKCSADSECQKDWKCAGPCAAF